MSVKSIKTRKKPQPCTLIASVRKYRGGKREMKGRTRASPVAKWLKEMTKIQQKIKQSSS